MEIYHSHSSAQWKKMTIILQLMCYAIIFMTKISLKEDIESSRIQNKCDTMVYHYNLTFLIKNVCKTNVQKHNTVLFHSEKSQRFNELKFASP